MKKISFILIVGLLISNLSVPFITNASSVSQTNNTIEKSSTEKKENEEKSNTSSSENTEIKKEDEEKNNTLSSENTEIKKESEQAITVSEQSLSNSSTKATTSKQPVQKVVSPTAIAYGNWGGTRYSRDTSTNTMTFISGGSAGSVDAAPWKNFKAEKIIFNSTVVMPSNMNAMWSGALYLKSFEKMSNVNVSNVTSMATMFYNNMSLEKIDLRGWDTSKNTSFSWAFRFAGALTSANLANLNVSNVTNFSGMFEGARSLKEVDFSGWKRSSRTVTSSNMFAGATQLKKITIPAGRSFRVDAALEPITDTDNYSGSWISENEKGMTYTPAELMGDVLRKAGTYVWERKKIDLNVEYRDENNKLIFGAQTKKLQGYKGDSYDVSTPEYKQSIPGYSLLEDKLPTNAKGKYNEDATIVYRYMKYKTPTLKAKNSRLYHTQTYNPKDNFVSGTDALGLLILPNDANLSFGGEEVKMTEPGTYKQTITYSYGDKQTVTADYNVVVIRDQTTVETQDVKLYVGDTFDPNSPLTNVRNKDGERLDAADIVRLGYYYINGNIISEFEKIQIDTSKIGRYQLNIALRNAVQAGIVSEMKFINVVEDQTSIEAKDIELNRGDKYDPEAGFIQATNADGEVLAFDKKMTWGLNGVEVDTTVAGTYQVVYGIKDHNGELITVTKNVVVNNLDKEINVTLPIEMLFSNTEDKTVNKKIESNRYKIINNSKTHSVELELSEFKEVVTDGIKLLTSTERDPVNFSEAARLNLLVDNNQQITSLNKDTPVSAMGVIKKQKQMNLQFTGSYFGEIKKDSVKKLKQQLVLKFSVPL